MNRKTYATNQSRRYLAFIVEFWKKNYYSPSTRDIALAFKTSTSVVNYYLILLEGEGLLLQRTKGYARQIIPIEVIEALDYYFERVDELVEKS